MMAIHRYIEKRRERYNEAYAMVLIEVAGRWVAAVVPREAGAPELLVHKYATNTHGQQLCCSALDADDAIVGLTGLARDWEKADDPRRRYRAAL